MRDLRYLFCMAGLFTLLLTSCGGDDDDSSYNSGTTVLETLEGDQYLVTMCGDYEYEYDDDGNLESFYDGDDWYDVTTSPFQLTVNDVDKYGQTTETTITLSTNGSGYVTKLVNEYNIISSYDRQSGKETANLSYDGSGQLTKISSSGSETYIDDYDSEEWSWSDTYSLTWNNNKITKIEYKSTESYADGDWVDFGTCTFDYDNNYYENTTRQYSPNIFLYSLYGVGEGLAYIGLLGLGPKYLPVGMEYEWTEIDTEDGETDTDEGEGEYYFTYKFNNDGTINYSAYSKNGTKYFYDYYSYDEYTATASGRSVTVREDEVKNVRRRLFHKFSRFSKENQVEE